MKTKLYVCAFLILFAYPHDFVSAESNPFATFTEKALNTAKTNRESIKTWKGSLLLEQTSFDPLSHELQRKLKAKIDFAIDVTNDRRISVSRVIEDDHFESYIVRRKNPPRITGLLFRDGLTHEFNYDPTPSKPINSSDAALVTDLKGYLNIKSGTTLPMVYNFPSAEYFNPFDGLSLSSSSDWKSLELLIANIDKIDVRKNFSFGMENDSKTNTTILNLTNNNNPDIITKYTFDENGLCVRRFCGDIKEQNRLGRYECIEERTYKKIGDIWVPEKIRVMLEHVKCSFEYTFTEHQINVPLDDDVFSLKALGVMQGDWAKDLRTGASYEIKDSSLPVRDLMAH